jgi:hypothetical protein
MCCRDRASRVPMPPRRFAQNEALAANYLLENGGDMM